MGVSGSHFDYKHQAWTFNGRYVRCGHPEAMHCDCYGKVHEGEPAEIGDLPTVIEEMEETSRELEHERMATGHA
jgi:hypothetical protein